MPRISHKREQGGRGRPFPKGVSGNPGGRPAKPIEQRAIEIDVRRYSRGFGRESVDKLVELMRGKVVIAAPTPDDPNKVIVLMVGPATQLSAALSILDRGYGKPTSAVEIAGKDGGPVVTETSAYDVIRSRLDNIARRLREDRDAEETSEQLN